PERQLSHEIYGSLRLTVSLVPELRVDQLAHLVVLDSVESHVGQVDLAVAPAHVDGWLRGHELDQHDAEAVHVALLGQLVALVVHRVDVARRALWDGRHVGDFRRVQARQPKVGDLHVEAVVQQYVVGLHVTVYDLDRVEVRQRLSCFYGDAHPSRPREAALRRTGSVDMVRDCSVGDELVHEHEVAAATGCAAIEDDQVL
uniref:Uncharacterized protein n=1 Tax=Zea mays TaxID=4577 RepID=A0A804QK47_MAIZE